MSNLLKDREGLTEEIPSSEEVVRIDKDDIENSSKPGRKAWKFPTNSIIDARELDTDHFAKGINCYKILLICYIGCFVGVILEIWWWYLKKGVIESRAGLVYGPFNMLYGAGTVIMTLVLYKFRNKSIWWAFSGGFIVGTVLEYMCSLLQELILGTQSWDYSRKPFNIDGRVCLLYSVFWGVLGIVWIKVIYPWLSSLILKISKKPGKIITWALTVFFAFNIVITMTSVFRWTQRKNNPEAASGFWEVIDERFPDSRMEKIFPNMKFKKRK